MKTNAPCIKILMVKIKFAAINRPSADRWRSTRCCGSRKPGNLGGSDPEGGPLTDSPRAAPRTGPWAHSAVVRARRPRPRTTTACSRHSRSTAPSRCRSRRAPSPSPAPPSSPPPQRRMWGRPRTGARERPRRGYAPPRRGRNCAPAGNTWWNASNDLNDDLQTTSASLMLEYTQTVPCGQTKCELFHIVYILIYRVNVISWITKNMHTYSIDAM